MVRVENPYTDRRTKDPYHAKHDDIYAKRAKLVSKLALASRDDHLRLEGCSASVAEQVLALVSLGGSKNPCGNMPPTFYAQGFELVAPDRSQVDVVGSVEIQVKNPRGLYLSAIFSPRGTEGERQRCTVEIGALSHLSCAFSTPGKYDVRLFSSREQYGSFTYSGQLEVNSD